MLKHKYGEGGKRQKTEKKRETEAERTKTK
jgi:hypothetical protein